MRNLLFILAILTCTSCSVAKLDPEYIAARIALRPTWLEINPTPSPELLLGVLPFRAGVELCNRNDLSIELVEAPWTAQLGNVDVGHGAIEGPVQIAANECTELIVQGKLSLAAVGAMGIQQMLAGQVPMPTVEIDAVARAHGFTVHRRLRLDGFLVRDGGNPRN